MQPQTPAALHVPLQHSVPTEQAVPRGLHDRQVPPPPQALLQHCELLVHAAPLTMHPPQFLVASQLPEQHSAPELQLPLLLHWQVSLQLLLQQSPF